MFFLYQALGMRFLRTYYSTREYGYYILLSVNVLLSFMGTIFVVFGRRCNMGFSFFSLTKREQSKGGRMPAAILWKLGRSVRFFE